MTVQEYLNEFIGIEHLPKIGDPSAYGKAVLAVLGADGQVSQKEMDYFLEHVQKMGFPQVIISELKEFDFRNASFEDYAAAAKQSSVGKMLLYDAIIASMADEYAERERQAVTRVAGILGIDDALVWAIEGLAGIDMALRQLEPTEELAGVAKAVREARISVIAPEMAELDIDEIAQVKRFHTPRTGLEGKDVIPVEFVDAVSAFRAKMDGLESSLAEQQIGETDAREQVLQTCRDFSDALLKAVNSYPQIESAIGAYGFRETFRYFMQSELIDRAYTKPRGYSGDYGTMEIIYENSPTGDGPLGPFIDEWGLNLLMAQAVRNRRKLLTEAIARVYDQWTGDALMPVASLASGSAREVFEVFSVRDKPRIRITCTDIDPEVYTYAARIATEVGAVENTVFLQENLLKMIFGRGKTSFPPQQLIYAVGLIDYLRDRELVALLNWAFEHLLPGGRAIIGQYHASSPDRAFLDHIADWCLYYRTEDEVRTLFATSKFGDAPVDIVFEDAGVQMFASCDKP